MQGDILDHYMHALIHAQIVNSHCHSIYRPQGLMGIMQTTSYFLLDVNLSYRLSVAILSQTELPVGQLPIIIRLNRDWTAV